jgi:hypothetical protein
VLTSDHDDNRLAFIEQLAANTKALHRIQFQLDQLINALN